jgi:hypothetical protein
LVVAINTRKVNYILDADIRNFFDSVSCTALGFWDTGLKPTPP